MKNLTKFGILLLFLTSCDSYVGVDWTPYWDYPVYRISPPPPHYHHRDPIIRFDNRIKPVPRRR